MLLQKQSHTLRPLTTAHLAQTMTLLGLTAVELRQKVDAELAVNPALELVEERRCPTCKRLLTGRSPCPVCSRPQTLSPDQPIVFISPREDFYTYRGALSTEEGPDEADNQTAIVDLPEYVLRQVATELAPNERRLAAHILTSLDEDGLLTIPLVEISRYHHVPLSAVERVLSLIQRADPVGVGSPNPQQALLVQIETLREVQPVHPYAIQAVLQGMDLLSRRRYAELGARLGISSRQAQEVAEFIRTNLNPFPARAHWGETRGARPTQRGKSVAYHFPDIIINRLHETDTSPLVVEVALPLGGTLRVNPEFREAIKHISDEKTEQWKNDLEQATLLVKCLQQRNHTLVRLMQRLTRLQREFILQGSAHMQPITRAAISKELGVHESTISRAVSGKSVQLPNGHIVPMAVFFDRSLHIRTALKQIIAVEKRPLSDTDLCERLEAQGHSIARRTVAKYRAMEGILPAHLRKPVDRMYTAEIP